MGRSCRRCGGVGYLVMEVGERAGAEVCECRRSCEQCGGTRFITGEDEDGYAVARKCDCVAIHRRVRLYNDAGIPAGYLHKAISSYHARGAAQNKVKSSLLRFQQQFEPKSSRGILLVGPPGRGKTHLLCGLLNYLTLEGGVACRFVDFFHLTARIRATYGPNSGETEEDLLGPLVEVPVLAIDELGKGRGTSWELGIVDQIISRRYNASRIVVATSNYLPEQWVARDPGRGGPTAPPRERLEESLEERVSDRIVSRLVEMCEVYRVEGVDHRTQALGRGY